MKKFLLILLFIYILWRDDFQKFFRTLKCSDGDLLTFLVKEICSKTPSELEGKSNLPSDDDFEEEGNDDSSTADASQELLTYSRKQVMDLLHVSETTLWRYQQNNTLTAHRVGSNRIVFIKSEVDALINKGQKGGVEY